MSMTDDEGYRDPYGDYEGREKEYEEILEEEGVIEGKEPSPYGRKLKPKKSDRFGVYDLDEDYFEEKYFTFGEMDTARDQDYGDDPLDVQRLNELESLIEKSMMKYNKYKKDLDRIENDYKNLLREYRKEDSDIKDDDIEYIREAYITHKDKYNEYYNKYLEYLEEYELLKEGSDESNVMSSLESTSYSSGKSSVPSSSGGDISELMDRYYSKGGRFYERPVNYPLVYGGSKSSLDIEKQSFHHRKTELENYIDELIKENKRLKEGLSKLEYMYKNVVSTQDEFEKIEQQRDELKERIKKNEKKYFDALEKLKEEKESKEKFNQLIILTKIKINNIIHDGSVMHPSKREELRQVLNYYKNNLLVNNLKSFLGNNYTKYIPDIDNFDFYVIDQDKGSKENVFPMVIKHDFDLTLEENNMTKGIYSFLLDYDKDYDDLYRFLEKLPRILEEGRQKKDIRYAMNKDVDLTIQSKVGKVFLKERKDVRVSRDITINDAIEKYFFDYFNPLVKVGYILYLLDKNKNLVRKDLDLNNSFLENSLYDDKYTIVISYNERAYKQKKIELEKLDQIERNLNKDVIITDDTNIEPNSITYNVTNSDVVMDVINKYFEEKPIDYPVRLVKVFEGTQDDEKNLITVRDFDKTFFDNKLNARQYYIKLFYFIDYLQTLYLSVADENNEKKLTFEYTVGLDTVLEDVFRDYVYVKLDYSEDIGVENFNFEVRDKSGNVITIEDPSLSMSDNQLFFKEYYITIFPNYFEINYIMEMDKALQGFNIQDIQDVPSVEEMEEPQLGFVEDEEFEDDIIF